MSEIDDGGPAYPSEQLDEETYEGVMDGMIGGPKTERTRIIKSWTGGLTKRDIFAKDAMAAMIAKHGIVKVSKHTHPSKVFELIKEEDLKRAKYAYRIADAMIEARKS